MSRREHSDAYAETLRPSNTEMINGFMRLGWMAPTADRHEQIREAFSEFDFGLAPASGWDIFLFELDLIFVQFDVPDTSKGHAKLRLEVESCISKLEELRSTFYEFNHSIDFSVASMLSKADTNDHIPTIEKLIKSHKIVSDWLVEHSQPPRWRERILRNTRVDLAIKLMTLFYKEFALPPKPDGGSSSLPIEEANEWQRFYQACAFMRLDERATPDRQSMLWEAYRDW